MAARVASVLGYGEQVMVWLEVQRLANVNGVVPNVSTLLTYNELGTETSALTSVELVVAASVELA
jgi:hypothetical protein